MGQPIRLLLLSLGMALATEVALLFNWRVLAAHGPVGSGIVDFTWIWPLVWAGMLALSLLCIAIDRMITGTIQPLRSGRTAGVMLLRLLVPMLLLVGPAIMLLYSVVMVLTAVGVTESVR
jgi:hypothetical protein